MSEIKDLPQPHLSHERLPDHPKNTYAWDIVLTLLFLGIVILFGSDKDFVDSIRALSVWNITIIILASFRLTHLITNDAVLQWFRDFFLIIEEAKNEDGTITIRRSIPERGIRREVALLLDCPWCVSVWVTMVTTILWIQSSSLQFLFMVFAGATVVIALYLIIKTIQAHLDSYAKK